MRKAKKVPRKRGRTMTLKYYEEKILKPMSEKFMEATKQYTPSQPLTLCGQLEDSVLLLENRISNVVAKLNSLM